FFGIDWLMQFFEFALGFAGVARAGIVQHDRGKGLGGGVFFAFFLQRRAELVKRLVANRSVGPFLHQLGKARFGGAEIGLLVIEISDQKLMPREHLAADGDLLMGERGETRFRIAPLDYLKLLERLLGVALILVGAADLIVVRHRQVV